MSDRARNDGSARLGRAAIAAIACSGPLSAYVFGGLVPVLPRIQEAFADMPGAGPMVRFLVSGIGLSMIVGAPLAGIAAGRFGRRRVLLVSLAAYAFFGVLGGLLDNLWAIVVSRLLFGLGAAASGTLLLALLAEMPEERRNRWLGLNTTLGTAATFVLIPLAGFLGAMSWRYPFFVHAFALIVMVFVAMGVPDRPAQAAAQAVAAQPAVKRRKPLFLIGIALTAGVLTSVFQLLLPFHLTEIGQKDPKVIGLLMMTSAVTTGIIAFFYRDVRRFLTMRTTFIASLATVAFGFTILAFSPNIPLFLTGMIVAGAGVGILSPHFYSLAAVTGPPSDAPRNMGFARAAYYCGPLVAQVLLEPVVSASTAATGVLVIAAIGAIAALIVSRMRVPYQAAPSAIAA
jgi:MFS family permease